MTLKLPIFDLMLTALISGSTALAAAQPNIIFILTDDQRQDTLGCTGDPIVKTPNIDKLAENGTLFSEATCTSAICTPSRASYFTGMHERNHGINFNSGTTMSPAAWQETYPVRLKDAGYFLGYIGKNHVPVGGGGYTSGLMDGTFDYWYAMHKHLYFYPKDRKRMIGLDDGMFDNAKADTQVEIMQEGMENFFNPNEAFYNNATRFLRKRPTDRPFCLSICFNLPHDCGTDTMQQRPTDPELYRTAYRDQKEAILANLPKTYVAKKDLSSPKLPADLFYTEYRQGTYNYVNTPEKMVERMILRYQAITGIDGLIGSLIEQLKEQGLADNTIIIYASDHGLFRGEFGLGGKSMNYDTNLRIPIIVYDPRSLAKGQVRTEAVQSIDVTATMLDYAGVKSPKITGKSLRPMVEGKKADWRDYAFSENLWSNRFGNPRAESVRGKGWKYIRYFKNDRSLYDMNVDKRVQYKVSNKHAATYQKWLEASINGEQPVYEELFNLKTDPDETTNLAADLQYAKKIKKLRKVCQKMVKEARGTPGPVANIETERREFYLFKMEQD